MHMTSTQETGRVQATTGNFLLPSRASQRESTSLLRAENTQKDETYLEMTGASLLATEDGRICNGRGYGEREGGGEGRREGER